MRGSNASRVRRRLLRVRQQFTRGGFSAPKSRAGRRVVTFGPKTAEAPEEQRNATLRRRDEDLVFGHPDLDTRSTLGARRLRA
jgi:hypothetical protein